MKPDIGAGRYEQDGKETIGDGEIRLVRVHNADGLSLNARFKCIHHYFSIESFAYQLQCPSNKYHETISARRIKQSPASISKGISDETRLGYRARNHRRA